MRIIKSVRYNIVFEHLTKPIKITSDLNSLKIEGSGKLKTFIKGSRLLNLNWRKFDQNIWVAEINKNIDFDQLYLNGEQQILARYPNYNENGGNWNGYAADAISGSGIGRGYPIFVECAED